ncbi:transcription initiation factor TFIID subunit 10 [Contarinia nasturtii]|uniref:transcription initiation factor TFIID subunit 10 n=1 Tax=Contarinia nasturtii TaxID=265458 RepID=UPI0012D4B7C1|nr:transcription initiation factor TFIID subunit 10 [Contarinia nasturtii]
MADNFGIHRGTPTPQASSSSRIQTTNPTSSTSSTVTRTSGGTSAIQDDRTQGQILSDFLHQLEDYTPTIPDAVTAYFCQTAGFEASDPRIVRLISVAAQKFVSDVANDALQHCKTRTSNAGSHGSKNQKTQNNKDRKYTLTMEDLAPALSDYGITVRKAHYFV